MSTVQDIPSESAFHSALSSLSPSALITIFFHTPWAAPCKQMRTFFDALASQYAPSPSLAFLAIDAEELPEISEDYDVTAVPFVVLVRDGKTIDSISGSNSARVRDAVEKEVGGSVKRAGDEGLGVKAHAAPLAEGTVAAGHTQGAGANGDKKDLSGYAPEAGDPKTGPEFSGGAVDEGEKEDINTRLTGLVKAAPVMLFMKGTPSSPQCGFSRQIVAILRERGVRYGFFNILADEDVRQGMKTFADWPTFPQLWVGGELVGGLDIVKEEIENDPDFFSEYSVGHNQGGMAAPDQQKAPQAAAA